jgi:peroxiredoxin
MLIWIGSIVLGVMIIAVLVFYNLKGGLSQQEQSSVTVIEDSTNKLRLEFPKTPAAAPNFELKDPAGKPLSLKDFRGKVVFLNFWATWCPPCIEEMPAMEKLHQELEKDGLVMLAVNFQEGPERVKVFFTQHNLTFTPLLDRDGKVTEQYQAWGLPVSVVINKRGQIAARATGSKDWHSDEARQFFKKLLADD